MLLELRQARGGETQRMRAPWLIPVRSRHGGLEFDLIVLHLKSGGSAPQAAEVNALTDFLRTRLSAAAPRHAIVCGDWNIRFDRRSPDHGRMEVMGVEDDAGQDLMRIITLEGSGFSMEDWERIAETVQLLRDEDMDDHKEVVARLLPMSHIRQQRHHMYTFLDHMSLSRTMDELFDHPIQVQYAAPAGRTDLVPGIEVVRPMIPEAQYNALTDHLPVVLTLRTTGAGVAPPPAAAGLRIVGVVPNPPGDDRANEEVRIRTSERPPSTSRAGGLSTPRTSSGC